MPLDVRLSPERPQKRSETRESHVQWHSCPIHTRPNCWWPTQPTRGNMPQVDPVEVLQRLGGVADRQALLRATTIGRVRGALARGEIIKAGWGGFALPSAQRGLRVAQQLSGLASHESAALHHGWEIKSEPEQPNVIVPRNRKVRLGERKRALRVVEAADGRAANPFESCLRAISLGAGAERRTPGGDRRG